MERPEAGTLLKVWERCAAQSTTLRGLGLLSAALPGAQPRGLAELSIGRRDAALLDLRARLFGTRLDCITACAHCGERIELAIPIEQIRVESLADTAAFVVQADGRDIGFRLPHSADLLAIEELGDPERAQRALVALCVSESSGYELSESAIAAIDQRMSEVDPQAEVQLEVACPVCNRVGNAVFDIVTHLWSELEAWVRTLMREIHVLAGAYGWSEAQILALSPARRRAYLDLVEAV